MIFVKPRLGVNLHRSSTWKGTILTNATLILAVLNAAISAEERRQYLVLSEVASLEVLMCGRSETPLPVSVSVSVLPI